MEKATKRKLEQDVPQTIDNQLNQDAAVLPTEEEIAVRAYHIYLERGGIEGNPDDDWLQAERDLAKGGE
jgi:hypothetical protein